MATTSSGLVFTVRLDAHSFPVLVHIIPVTAQELPVTVHANPATAHRTPVALTKFRFRTSNSGSLLITRLFSVCNLYISCS